MPLRLLYQEENAIRPDVGFDPVAHIASKKREALDVLQTALNEANAAIAKLRGPDVAPTLDAANAAIGRPTTCIKPNDKIRISHPSHGHPPKCLYMADGRELKSSFDCATRAKKEGTFKFERV